MIVMAINGSSVQSVTQLGVNVRWYVYTYCDNEHVYESVWNPGTTLLTFCYCHHSEYTEY